RRSRSARTPGITRSTASRSWLMSIPEWYDGPPTGLGGRPSLAVVGSPAGRPSVAVPAAASSPAAGVAGRIRGLVAATPARGLPGRAAGGRQPLAQPSGAGADPLTDLVGSPGHPAHQLEQRVLGALEGLPVGVGRTPDVLRHRRLLVGAAAWIVAGQDAGVAALVDPPLQLRRPRDRQRVAAEHDQEQLEDAV